MGYTVLHGTGYTWIAWGRDGNGEVRTSNETLVTCDLPVTGFEASSTPRTQPEAKFPVNHLVIQAICISGLQAHTQPSRLS